MADQTSLSLTWSQTPKTGFLRDEAHIVLKATDLFAVSSLMFFTLHFNTRTASRILCFLLVLYEPRQANLVLIAYASSEGSGEPAHPRSLARTSATRSYKQ